MEKLDLWYLIGNVKWYSTLENTLAVFYKTEHTLILELSNCAPVHLSQRSKKLRLYKNLYRNVHAVLFIIAKTYKNSNVQQVNG